MADDVIDSLSIEIESESQKAGSAIDELIGKLGQLKTALKGFGNTDAVKAISQINNVSLKNVSAEMRQMSQNMEAFGNKAKNTAKAVREPMRQLSETVAQIEEKYKGLGQDFKFSGNTESIQKQIDKYSNSLEKAKLKKQELELSGKTDGQGYENAVRGAIKYSNILESLKNQLEEVKKAAAEIEMSKPKEQAYAERFVDIPNGLKVAGWGEAEENIKSALSGVAETATEAKKRISEMGQEIAESVNNTDGFKSAMSTANSVVSQMKEQFGSNYQAMSDYVKSLESQLNNLIETKIAFLNAGGQTGSNLFKGYEASIESLREKIRLLKDEMPSQLTDQEIEIKANTKELDMLPNLLNNIKVALGKVGSTDATAAWAGKIGVAVTVLNKFLAALGKIKGKIDEVTSSFKAFASKLKTDLSKQMKELGKSISKNFNLANLIKRTAIRRIISNIFRAIESAFKTGMQNIAQYSADVNNNISALMSSLLYLKNAFAAAFAPILDVVVPVLSTFIDYIATAVNAIGQLISALTGKGFAVQAKKVQQDYAASLGGTAKAAGSAADAVEELNDATLGIDEFHVIDEDKGSKGGGGGGAGGVSAGDMFETVEIGSKFKNLAGEIKAALEDGGWQGVGALIGGKLKTALDSIPWDEIQSKVKAVSVDFANLINGFTLPDVDLFYSIGKTIAEGLNTITYAFESFGTTINWANLGKSIGSAINGFFENYDFAALGHTITIWANGLLEEIIAALNEIKWETIGKKINDFFGNLNLDVILANLGVLITTLASKLTELGNSIEFSEIGEKIGNALNNLFNNIDASTLAETINTWAHGILDFIISALETTEWVTIGDKIQEFFDGVDWGGIFEKVATVVWELAKVKFTVKFNLFLGIFKSIPEVIDGIMGSLLGKLGEWTVNAIGTLVGAAQQIFTDVGQWFADLSDKIDEVIGGLLEGFIAWAANAVSTFVEAAKNIFTDVGQWFADLHDKINEIIGGLLDKFIEWGSNAWDTFSEWVGKIVSGVVEWFGGMVTNVVTAIGGLLGKIVEWGTGVYNGFSEEVRKVIDAVVGWFGELPDKILEAIKGLWSKITDIGSSIKDGILEGMNNIGNGVKGFVGNLLGTTKKDAKIHSPSALFRDEVGTYLGEGVAVGFEQSMSVVMKSVDSMIKLMLDTLKSVDFVSVFNEWQIGFSDSWTAFSTTFSKSWTEFWKSMGESMVSAMENSTVAVVDGLNKMVSVWNKVTEKLSSAASSFSVSGAIKKISFNSVPKFELGGFPDMGELFIANENGPELVGRIGTQNAVANNDQIVNAVKQGVFEAVTMAMANQSTQPIEVTSIALLDGDKVYENQQKVAAKRGINFGMAQFAR